MRTTFVKLIAFVARCATDLLGENDIKASLSIAYIYTYLPVYVPVYDYLIEFSVPTSVLT